ncbi:DUF6799 domain-containing protein, partial [Hymenobacter agri]
MKYPLLPSLLLAAGLLVATTGPANAQKRNTQAVNTSLPWFTVANKMLVVQTGTSMKVLEKDVTLPNGTRVEYQTQSVVLANGTRVRLKEGDLLSLNGELIQKSPTNTAPPADATASIAPVSSPVPNVQSAPVTAPQPAAPAAPAPAPA